MKRKFKLITSVASLCLAIALMAFGVYAASAPKLTVSGTVTFTADQIYATVTMQEGVGADLAGVELKNVTVTKGVWGAGTSDTDAQAIASVGKALSDAAPAYKYVVTITSATPRDFKATLATIPSTDANGAELKIEYSVDGGAATEVTAANTAITIPAKKVAVITVSLVINPAVANANVSVNMGMEVNCSNI